MVPGRAAGRAAPAEGTSADPQGHRAVCGRSDTPRAAAGLGLRRRGSAASSECTARRAAPRGSQLGGMLRELLQPGGPFPGLPTPRAALTPPRVPFQLLGVRLMCQ